MTLCELAYYVSHTIQNTPNRKIRFAAIKAAKRIGRAIPAIACKAMGKTEAAIHSGYVDIENMQLVLNTQVGKITGRYLPDKRQVQWQGLDALRGDALAKVFYYVIPAEMLTKYFDLKWALEGYVPGEYA